jgi:hypothetical protein
MGKQGVEKDILKYITDGLLYDCLRQAEKENKDYRNDSFAKSEFEKGSHLRAEKSLEEYKKTILSDEIKKVVVNDCREALITRTKWDKVLEVGIIFTTAILAILLVIISTISFLGPDTIKNFIWVLKTLSISTFVICITNLLCYALSKFKS